MLDFGAVVEYTAAPGNEVLLTRIRTSMGTYRKRSRCCKNGRCIQWLNI